MKKNVQASNLDFPDIDIIDLENPEAENTFSRDSSDETEDNETLEEDFFEEEPSPQKSFPKINFHIVFVLGVLLVFVLLVVKFLTWGERVDLDKLFAEGEGHYEDTFDSMIPVLSEEESPAAADGITTIVAFGNAPFADDRDSEDNLLNMIADESGAVVYNFAVEGSYLAALEPIFNTDKAPMDAFNFYWLTALATLKNTNHHYEYLFEQTDVELPSEAKYVYETLSTLDFNTVDVVTVMYDGSDYLAGHEMYNDDNATDIMQFTGNMEAGIELLLNHYPHLRIIVMSPTYAYAIDENGDYVSSDIYTYGQDVLSTYVIKQFGSAYSREVTFVDNLYGTITEDNADKYLEDNIHLNVKGRKLVADRFLDALHYFDNVNTNK